MRAGPVVVVALLLAGCTAAEPPTPAAGTSPTDAVPAVEGIEAEAVRLRSDVAAGRRLQVRVTDTGAAPFTVTAVALDAPGFTALPPRAADTGFTPGRLIDLPVEYGPVDCAVAPGPAAARLTVVRPGGEAEELRVPLAGDTLARLHADECAAQAVLAAVDVAVTDLAGAGDTLAGDLVLTRRSGDEEVAVTALGPSVVLEPVLADLPATLRPAADRLRLPVTFDAGRCDPHALAETKQPFVFPLHLTVGDGPDVHLDLPLDDAHRARLQAFLGRVCTG